MSDQALGLIIMTIMAWIIVCGIPMLIASRLAYSRGRSRGGAVALAFLFGWLALPFVACMRTDWRVIGVRFQAQYEQVSPDNDIGLVEPEIPRRRARR